MSANHTRRGAWQTVCSDQYSLLLIKRKRRKKMSKTKDFRKENGERPENVDNENAEAVEGYVYCTTHKQKCLNDCAFGGPAISHID